jgi:2-polyprenyl-3-methyl-5-hydroxy-6-metoxy-1,4-benzoquinol methylase
MNPVENPSDYYGHPRREMVPFVPEGVSRILDVGCGAGGFAASLKEARGVRLQIWGVEVNAEAAARAAEVVDEVRVGNALEIVPSLPPGHFDCIVLNDVLEHLPDPALLLAGLRPLLSPTGVLVASVPNVRFFWNVWDLALKGRWDYSDEGICDRTHLRFFTRSSLAGLFADSGYAVERMVGINPTGSSKFALFDLLTLGRFSDMRYLQFAVVTSVRR